MNVQRASLVLLFAAGAAAAAPSTKQPPPPLITSGETQEWTLHGVVPIRSTTQMCVNWCAAGRPGGTPVYNRRDGTEARIAADDVKVFYPVFPGCASATVSDGQITSTLKADGVLRDDTPAYTDCGAAGGRFGKWTIDAPFSFEILLLQVDVPMVCRETKLDEKRAMTVRWPSEDWPADVADALASAAFFESKDPDVVALMRKWVGDKPKSIGPALTAKKIMGGVIEHVQPVGDGLTYVKRDEQLFHLDGTHWRLEIRSKGFPQAIIVGGAAEAARSGKGSPHDLPCLFVAACRAAGLPARLVIGLDTLETARTRELILRSWAEFYLYDEEFHRGEWIPVDPMRQREFGSRALPIEQSWTFFGNNDTLDSTVPISFTFDPPASLGATDGPPTIARDGGIDHPILLPGCTPVTAENPGPALWGWAITPSYGSPDYTIGLTWAEHTIHRGGKPAARK